MTRADVPIGALLTLASLIMLWQALGLPYGSEFAPGPGFAPTWITLLGVLNGALIVVTAWRQPDLPPAPPSEGGRRGLARVAASLLGLIVMMALLPALGLLLAVLVYLLFLTVVIERLSLIQALGASLGTVVFIDVVFKRLLGVPLPAGPLGF